jgi:methylmalonyl-CoA mutase
LDQIRSQNFPIKSLDDWIEKAELSLKGRKVESLQSNTYETITLKPLYTREDEKPVSNYPGGTDFRRGIDPLGYLINEWKVAQRISYETVGELTQKLEDAFKRGQTAISFEVSEEVVPHLSELPTEIIQNYPFAINSKWYQAALLNNLAALSIDGTQLTGYIANDPIALFAEEGVLTETVFKEWSLDVMQAEDHFPNLRTILIDTTPYHNGGANAVQELAIAAATGVFYLEKRTEDGIEPERTLSKMIFQFAIGSNFFMELAKLRASRILWNRISELYRAEEKARGMQIAAVTSSFTKTVFDPHVNLLRGANEAFAAVLGGVQYLHVEPFDQLTGSSPFSERIARNTQLILKEEALLQKVVDPAGGSWYIEALTTELADKAWALFQTIDAKGGILEVLKTNWLQQEIAAVFAKKRIDIETRKQSIIGTNVYARPDETALYKTSLHDKQNKNIEAIPQRRLAEPYEKLRSKAKKLAEQKGSALTVGLLCLGELKQHKARADFMKGFLSAGGIKTVDSPPIGTVAEARQYLTELPSPFVVFCGTNEQYEQLGHKLLTTLKPEFPKLKFFLAGLPDKENQSQWLADGITQFIHVKSNCYETLAGMLEEWEVTFDESQQA